MVKKYLGCLLFINLISFAQVPTYSLSAYYPLNGNTLDYVGTRHGVSAGIPQYGTDRFGHPNGCYDVIGNSNHIDLPNDYWIKGDYSVSAWVKIKQNMPYARVYDFANGFVINDAFGKLCHGWGSGPTMEYAASLSSESHYFSSNPLPLNTWLHLVFISSGTKMTIYVNNVLDGYIIGNHVPENIFRTKNRIGGSNATAQDDTNAFIDDFRLYERALTSQEVTDLYNEPDNFVGISEQNNEIVAFNIFPNPATDYIDINFSSTSTKQTKIELFDNIGKSLSCESFETIIGRNNLKINVNDLADGFYYLNITTGTYTKKLKFIKTK